MNYVGQLYGRLGRKYFPLGITSDEVDSKDALLKEAQYRIASLLEADAGRPVRDINGTIEALDKRIAHQQAVIKQYRTEMQALQRKVQEQDEKLKQWNDYFDKEQP